MGKLIATRVSEDIYSKILQKCADSGCSTYDYLKMLIETDTNEIKEIKQANDKEAVRLAIDELSKIAQEMKSQQSGVR